MKLLLVYCLNLVALIPLLFWFLRLINRSKWRIHFISALIFKVICGGLLGLLYIWIYDGGGDTFGYYNRASGLASQGWSELFSHIFQPIPTNLAVRQIFFDRTLAVVLYLTRTDYWFAGIYFSLFSFICSFYLVKQIIYWRPDWSHAAIFSFLFFPSIVFWSSGILKESISFGAMMVLVAGYVKLRSGRSYRWYELAWYALSLILLVKLKYYIVAIALPLLIYLVVFKRLDKTTWLHESLWRKTLLIGFVLLIPSFFLMHWLNWNLQLNHFIDTINQTHYEILQRTPVWNKVRTIDTSFSLLNVTLNFFHFTFAGIFRPIFPEIFRFPNIMSAVENLFFVVIVLWRLLSVNRIKYNADLLAITVMVISMAFFLSYSIPNLGSLARFKVYYAPFLMLVVLIDHPLWKVISKWKWSSDADIRKIH